MFEIGATLFLITNVQYALGAPMQLNVSTLNIAPETEEDTTLSATLGTVCTVIATAVAVFTLCVKCRKDGPIGVCCSKLTDIASCKLCGLNKVMGTCCLDLVLCIPCRKNNEYQTENDTRHKRIECTTSKILRIVIIGKSGSGKIETGNALLGQKKFKPDKIASSVTQCCESKEGTFLGQKVIVTDTPGIFDPTAKIDILLFVLRVGRLTQEDADRLCKLKHQFGEAVEKNLVVAFTHSSVLKKFNTTEADFIQSAKRAIPLLQNLENRFVFLEHDPKYSKIERKNQLRRLLDVVQNVQTEEKDTCNGNDMYDTRLVEIQEQKRHEEEDRIEKKRKKEEEKNLQLEIIILEAKQAGQKEMRAMFEQNTEELKKIIIDHEASCKKQRAVQEKQGQQVLTLNQMDSKTVKACLHALVHKLDEKVVCGFVITNKTKHRLINPEIKLASFGGGRIFMYPTMDSIDENDVCTMIACKTTGFRGTKGLITWDIDGKNLKIGIMWSVPYWTEPNRLAVGFPCSNDTQTQDDMYNQEVGDIHCRREFKVSENPIEKRYNEFLVSGFMRSDRHTIVEVQLSTKT